MVRTFLKVYTELGSYFLFLQEQIKDIIIIRLWRAYQLEVCETEECVTECVSQHSQKRVVYRQ
jgi:hypothetical protein